ncbi:MAG: T9SS type A sorting domain-containing protein [Bacteroidales bacterium]|nr:T9SS type A sorting domain-containing protein [Bacteroidales bacterium]
MKKIFIIFISFIFPLSILGENGNGSSGSPFYGTITSTVQWSVGDPNYGFTVYVGTSTTPDLTVGSGGHLTIDPGITVIFTQLTSDLIITGSGILTAEGTNSGQILFTKASDKSHWGHISFETPGSGTPITGTGTFEYCTVQYGYAATSGTNPDNAGGGIQVNANDVTIINCLIENNYSNFGGGITVNAGRNTIIRKTIFKSNDVNEAGGGLLLWTSSTALVENCIFEDNYSKGNSTVSYSGGAIWLLSSTSKIVNCTFVENTSDRPGDGIYSYASSNARIINSVLWGSNDQFAGSSTTSTIVTCAFESAKPANAANSIIISDVALDHFVDAGSGDWSLKFISPCRDAGTIPSPTVPNDYLGNSRIGAYDIGSYEVQYSRWTGSTSTDWSTASNWDANVDPSTGTGDVVVPTGLSTYPVSSSNPDFTIGSEKQMIIEQGVRVTLDNLTNNGIIKLNHNATGFASLIINSYTRGSGATEEIQLYLTGGGDEDTYKWHYISTPVSSIDTSVFTVVTPNLAQFVESYPSISLLQGWVACDGYVYSTGTKTGPKFSSLSPGKGYDFWDNTNNTFTFGGLFNISNTPMLLDFSGVPSSKHGFNLLGNPFSSGLNWDDIINSVYFTYPSNTSKGLYFTRNNVQCTYAAGVGVPGDVTGIIPPMQGFFTKTYSTGNSITLPAAARTHNNIHARYKGETIIPLVRLAVFEDTVSNDETVVRFDEEAKSDLDNDFDALKMFLSSSITTIHTSMGGVDYAINGQPFPAEGTTMEIPVVVNVTTTGNHKISAIQLQGLDNYSVSLKDNTSGFLADLKTTQDLTFTSPAGLLSNRFVLLISGPTGIENPAAPDIKFNIWQGYGFINIRPIADDWDGKSGSVKVLDMAGRTVSDLQNTEFSKNSVTQVQAPEANGLYFIEIRSGVKRYVGKVVIK